MAVTTSLGLRPNIFSPFCRLRRQKKERKEHAPRPAAPTTYVNGDVAHAMDNGYRIFARADAICYTRYTSRHWPGSSMDRASVFGTECWGFESLPGHQNLVPRIIATIQWHLHPPKASLHQHSLPIQPSKTDLFPSVLR